MVKLREGLPWTFRFTQSDIPMPKRPTEQLSDQCPMTFRLSETGDRKVSDQSHPCLFKTVTPAAT